MPVQLDRRTFLRGVAATSGGVLVGGSLQAMVAQAVGAAPPVGPPLEAIPDLRDGKVRLHVPAGFQYRSFHDTDPPGGVVLGDGTVLPGRHDGMAAFHASDGNVWLVRNHEVNGPGAAFGPGAPYDSAGRGGTTSVLVTPQGEVLTSFTSLNGTQMNCSGGRMPWGTWITCEETVNGPDVGPDFTLPPVSNVPLQERHGYVFEVAAGLQGSREPIRAAGRFAHEAAAWDPVGKALYLTEDNFGFPSGLYRYLPPTDPMVTGRLADGGELQMARVTGTFNAHLEGDQTGAVHRVKWVTIGDADPHFPYTPGVEPPTTNHTALTYVAQQGWAQGAAWFSRLEGAVHREGEIWFTSTQGGGADEVFTGSSLEGSGGFGNGTGQVWSFDPATGRLRCRFQSTGAEVLDFPDNITARTDGGSAVLCEDSTGDNYIRALHKSGVLVDVALNRNTVNATGVPRYGDEFAGATFARNTLFVNMQASNGVTFAIWGPWATIGV